MQFEKKEISLIPGHRQVIFIETEVEDASNRFKIVANAGGVYFVGHSTTIKTSEDLNTLAVHIAKAWQYHEKLKNELLT